MKIFIHYCSPLKAHQTHFLDLLIFSLQKSEIQQIRVQNKLNWQTIQIIKILDSWQKVTLPRNILSAFRRGGLIVEWNSADQKLYG